jgi:DNA polymerase-3 subunit beta
MKFSCERALLLAGINAASKTVAVKSTIPALEGLLLSADDELVISGYNLKTGIRTHIPVEVAEGGAIVLNARLFGEIIRRMADDVVTFSSDANGLVKLTCGLSKFEIMGTAADDFPELPEVDETGGMKVPEGKLKSLISETLFAVSDNETRPIYMGSLFETDGETLTVVSVDGFRLALRREKMDKAVPGLSFVVPGSTLTEVERLCSDSEEDVSISLGSRHIMFVIGNTEVISRRLEGDFLDYKRTVATPAKYIVTADRRGLIDAVERVSLIINEKVRSPLRFVFDKNQLLINCSTALGQASDEVSVAGDGEGMEIGFNNRYVLDALKAAPADEVAIRLVNNVSPCIIVPADESDSFLYMILPVRIRER